MNHDIYAPPMSDPTPDAPIWEKAAGFYTVSPRKFWILLISTLGIYKIYWFYRHWVAHKKATGESMWPGMRALFSIFFTHSLFRLIHAANGHKTPPLSSLATCFVLLSIIDNVMSRMSNNAVGSPWTDMLSFCVLPLTGFCLAGAQKQANLACGDPDGSTNNRITGANIVWIVLGMILWALGIYGLLLTLGVLAEPA